MKWVNMTLAAHMYFRESHNGMMRRVFVHGEQQNAADLRRAETHLAPETPEGLRAEEALCRQRGWIMASLASIKGVQDAVPLEPGESNIDFDIFIERDGDWETVMQGVSDVLAHVLGQGAVTSRLDYPI